jgi:hypothetical protein
VDVQEPLTELDRFWSWPTTAHLIDCAIDPAVSGTPTARLPRVVWQLPAQFPLVQIAKSVPRRGNQLRDWFKPFPVS